MHGIIQDLCATNRGSCGLCSSGVHKMEEPDWTGCRSDLGESGIFESSAPMVTCLRGLLEEHRTPAHAISSQGPLSSMLSIAYEYDHMLRILNAFT
jgi:hypothetical protein